MKDIVERFLDYVSFETTSYEPIEGQASSVGQYVLAKHLKEELEKLDVKNLYINEFGTVVGYVPGTKEGPTIALIAHMDTSNSASGKDVKARVLKYEGGDIELSTGIKLSPNEFSTLKGKEGHELVVTDGTTLLGGDDKAGIAIIVNVIEKLKENNVEHLPIQVIFSTDEEIGVGADHIKDEDIKADFGYTVDGGCLKYISVENFNAGSLKVVINGRSIHPGDAKDKMINALNVGIDFHNAIPRYERPEHTACREGFYHLLHLEGTEEHAELTYIIRDHDLEKLLHRFEIAELTAERINKEIGSNVITLQCEKDSYRNMKPELDKHPEVTQRIVEAYKELGLEYEFEPIRGGTDGAHLTYRGLPCPNLATGDYNCHGRFEYVDVDEMKKMIEVVYKIVTK